MFFSREITLWYNAHKRDLPWRKTKDPYVIWLSEIILQQTRVEQGLPYFHAFLDRFPTIDSFASARESDILHLWQGLGYYSRGRNMHQAAQQVLQFFDGKFPTSYQQLLSLKGIGAYTAAAISSFSANEVHAVLDGNVFRVLARYFDIDIPINSTIGKKTFEQLAYDLLDKNHPASHNQAIMEFGALHCTPKNPLCSSCPVQIGCLALKHNRISQLPVKIKKNITRNRYFYYFVFQKGEEVMVNQRNTDDIWANMYDFPLIETEAALSLPELIQTEDFKLLFNDKCTLELLHKPKKHILSHQNIYAVFYKTSVAPILTKPRWHYVLMKELDNLAKPKLIFDFVKRHFTEAQTVSNH